MTRTKNDSSRPNVVLISDGDMISPQLDELQELVRTLAPRIFFHSDDQNFPLSVEAYLGKASLVEHHTQRRHAVNAKNLNELITSGESHLELSGMIPQSSPIAYVHAKEHQDGFTDLQYWFLFAQNQPVSAILTWMVDGIKGHEGEIKLDPLGNYQGHWERLTLRVRNSTREVEQAYFPQSGKGAWIDVSKLKMEGKQVVAFASRNNSFYPSPLSDYSESIKFDLVSSQMNFNIRYISGKGTEMDFSEHCQLISAAYLGDSGPEVPAWLNYRQNWGNPSPAFLNPTVVKDLIVSAFGPSLEFLLTRDVRDGLVRYLLNYFTTQYQALSLSPAARTYWLDEETSWE